MSCCLIWMQTLGGAVVRTQLSSGSVGLSRTRRRWEASCLVTTNYPRLQFPASATFCSGIWRVQLVFTAGEWGEKAPRVAFSFSAFQAAVVMRVEEWWIITFSSGWLAKAAMEKWTWWETERTKKRWETRSIWRQKVLHTRQGGT